MMKTFVTLLFVLVLFAFATGVQATIVYQVGFETLPLGIISTPENGYAVGNAANQIDGRWREIGTIYPDPSVVNNIAHTGTQSLRISRRTAGQNSVGWTTAASVLSGTPFEFSFYANMVSGGSYIVVSNNYNNIQTDQPVSLYIDSSQNIQAQQMRDDGSIIWRDTGADAAVGAWTGVKAVIKSWGDGSATVAGRGFYDVYVDTGTGWVLAYANIGFNSSMLYDGVNTIYVNPQAPTDSISGYMDDAKLVVTPKTCAEVFTLGKGLAGDLDQNCRVDLKDFAVLADEWFVCNDPNNPVCIVNW